MSKRSLFVRLVPCRCLRGEEETVTSLDYSHCSLETVPKEIFSFEKTLQELYLDANQIEELPKQLFNCQLLNRLSMPDNDLTVLPAAIANLVNLRELDVSKNSIQEFPENIKNCKVLAIVEASVNPISKLPEGFTQLLSLTQLYLNDAFLEFLPASFGRLTKLQILELRENQLKMLPKSMQKLTQLERLDLGSNEFTEVPEVLEQLTGIKELWMDGNRLTFLPGMMGMLKELVYLDVSKNNLEMVDEQICGCESLQDLLLSNNALTQLPGSIGSLKKLTALKVDENQLMYLPDSIGGLTSIDELDCSFNEIEALPSSVGQCTSIRTFAADHNFLTQLPPEMGNWKNATVLFLHSNKLESLPEEMGDMQRLKVINLSNNKLKNLPYSFTKLNEMTAMWLSENQSKPLIPLQKEEDPETHKTVLTNYMFPQQTRTEDYVPNSDSESFNPALWEEQRKHRAQVAFECDEDKDERETPPREGNLKRYPTPYPDELKNMVKTAQSVAHRLKEDESSDETGKDAKPIERNHIGVQDVGVKVIEAPCPNGVASDMEPQVSANTHVQNPSALESKDTSESYSSQKIPLKSSEGSMMNHEDTLEDSEELSDEEEEMKVAEMRPPLIEISINQPKVVTLSKDKKDDGKDADSLLDDTVANSNQNNSNCSSPSRMSDSVSLTTDSSQDNSLCTPEREAKMPFLPKTRQEDENMNQPKDTTPLLHNGNGSETSLQTLLKTQQTPPEKMGDYDLSMEARLAFIEKGINNGMGDAYTKWDQINMNVAKLPTDNMVQLDGLDKTKNGSVAQEDLDSKQGYGNDNMDHLQNGNQQASDCINSLGNKSQAMRVETSAVHVASTGVTASSDMSLSRSTEELSPEKRSHPPQVMKSHSISNIETGGMKLYSFDGDDDSYDTVAMTRMAGAGPGPGTQGQSIVRSKSASQLLNDQTLMVYPSSSASSSDLLSSSKPPASTSRYPVSSSMAMGIPPPQYNVQYTSSAMPKDGLWTQRTAMPPEHQGYLPPPPHSLANTNYSNRNQAPPYPLQPQQRGPSMAPKPSGDMWAKERLHTTGGQHRSSTLQRQSSTASTASMGDPRRIQVPDGEYMTYRDIHTLARGPLAMSQAMQRPLSARTYSIDVPGVSRPVSARPQPHELPERTMSVSDFNYQHSSPSKRPNTRVKSEHSLLDGPGQVPGGVGAGRVPTDWRDQVMRHIEAKKMEKNALSRSYNSNTAPLSWSHYGSCRDMHASQGSLVFSAREGQPYGALGFCDDVFASQGPQSYTLDPHRKVPLVNGQMGPSVRPQMSQASMARHPSREQLIDYLMLKVSQQPPGPPRIPHDGLQQEIRVKVEKNPELGFSISGGVGGRGNPFRPDDNGIFVTRVQPEGPASKILQPGDKIIQANGYSFVNIDHGNAVSLLKKSSAPASINLPTSSSLQTVLSSVHPRCGHIASPDPYTPLAI
ncbi:erbin isoform X12 [Acanthochromis polyacanthus]|uniref:erbin isoform X11 n=1 Tax=Acanthochromis polyacanthus TaxID=80966 RepID=UPI0022347FA1|nr:erbin isoform X11 [Acanthochromis polyacanthus]XP_051794435.1 erbin isoform X12 [Acanthochromis polyacanthus]